MNGAEMTKSDLPTRLIHLPRKRKFEVFECASCGAIVPKGMDWLPRYCSNCGKEVKQWVR